MGLPIGQLILSLASAAYQQSQYRKLKKAQEAEAEKRRGSIIPVRGQAESVPVVYGRAAMGGIEVKHRTSGSYSHVAGDYTKNLTASVSGTKNEFLLVQSVLAQKEIGGVDYIKVDDALYDDKQFNHNFKLGTPGTANALATANGVPSTATFTNCTHLTSVFRLKRDEPQYQGIPNVTSFMRGRKVRKITENLGTYTLNTTYEYTNNPAYCLLDYLMDDDYGLGISESEVNIASFKQAADICDITVSSNRLVGGRIHGVGSLKEYASASNLPPVGDDAFLYKVGANDFRIWTWNNPDDEEQGGSYSSTTAPTRNIPLYECNIVLDSQKSIRDNIRAILNTMGLAELTWTSEGQYKLILAYPTTNAALEALVDADHEFTADNIIREEVTLSWPSAEDRLNQATVRFQNEHEDFAEDSMTWPVTNSTAHQTFLSEDNNRPFVTNVSLEGITDPYHALARAEQLVRESRTRFDISMTVDRKALSLEPGDFFSVTLPQQDLDGEIFRVNSIKVMSDLTVEVTGSYFDINALAWSVNDDIAYVSPPTYDFTIEAPTNLTTTPSFFVSGDGSVFNSIKVDWDNADDSKVRDYEVQYKQSTDTGYQSALTQNETYEIINVVPNVTYDVRVRARTATGILSEFISTTDSNAGKDVAPNAPTNPAVEEGYQLLKLTFTPPADKDLSHVEVNEGTTNNFNSSTLAGYANRGQFIRPNLSNSQTLYFWIRSVDFSGNTSSWVGPVSGTTALIGVGSFEEEVQDILDSSGFRSVSSLPTSGEYTNEIVFNLSDNRIYRWTGTDWSTTLYTDILPGSVDENGLASGAVTTAKIAAAAVTTTEIADDSISTPKIVAGAVTAGEIATGAITTDKISAGAVVSNSIAANAIIADKIAAGAVAADKMSVSELSAITADLGTISVDTAHIDDAAITTAKVADAAITNAKIDNLNADKITAGTINAQRIPTLSTAKFDIVTGDSIGGLQGSSDPAYTADFAQVSFTPTATSEVIIQLNAMIDVTPPDSGSTYNYQFKLYINNVLQSGVARIDSSPASQALVMAHGFTATANTAYTIKVTYTQSAGRGKGSSVDQGALTAIFTQQ